MLSFFLLEINDTWTRWLPPCLSVAAGATTPNILWYIFNTRGCVFSSGFTGQHSRDSLTSNVPFPVSQCLELNPSIRFPQKPSLQKFCTCAPSALIHSWRTCGDTLHFLHPHPLIPPYLLPQLKAKPSSCANDENSSNAFQMLQPIVFHWWTWDSKIFITKKTQNFLCFSLGPLCS